MSQRADTGIRPESESPSWTRALLPSAALALTLFAYRPLYLKPFRTPAAAELENWFFDPDGNVGLLALAVAAWLLWRRWGRLRALPTRSNRAMSALLLVVGVSLYCWARLVAEDSLLLPSLAANLLSFASATRGLAGLRVALLPALVMLLGVPLPDPLRNELLWQLQLGTARGATWLMQVVGYDIVSGGVFMEGVGRTFTVIESCSGLRGIEIVTLLAFVVRDLFAPARPRLWWLIALAPLLGFILNIVRVAVVVAGSTDLEVPALAAEDHSVQGVLVLALGTVCLYVAGWVLAGDFSAHASQSGVAATRPREGRDSQSESSRDAPQRSRRSGRVWGGALTALVGLALVSVGPMRFPLAPAVSIDPVELPMTRGHWRGEDLTSDWAFVGYYLSWGQSIHRRYKRLRVGRAVETVDLFVGTEVPANPFSSRLFSSKTAVPGRAWSLQDSGRTRSWSLGLEMNHAVASRGAERALVYSWRLRDRGLWREAGRSLLALERSPYRRERSRAVVRISTPLPHAGPLVRDRAKQTLNRFISDFRAELADL